MDEAIYGAIVLTVLGGIMLWAIIRTIVRAQ